MKKTLCISVLLASLQLCLGQYGQPSGQVSFHFGPETVPVWDVTGEYVPVHSAYSGGQTSMVAYLLALNLDASGRIRSSGATVVAFGNDYVASYYSVSGTVSGGGASTPVNFSVRLNGYDMIAGAPRKFSVSLNYKLHVTPVDSALVGTVSGSVYINGVGNSRIKEDVALPLPEGATGAWSLTLNILSIGQIGGTGTFSLSDFTPPDHPAGFPTDRLLSATASGSYSQHTGLSKVTVKGIYEGRGTSVTVTFNPAGNSVEKLSGKVLGQSVKFPN